jgi:hypothetical protein
MPYSDSDSDSDSDWCAMGSREEGRPFFGGADPAAMMQFGLGLGLGLGLERPDAGEVHSRQEALDSTITPLTGAGSVIRETSACTANGYPAQLPLPRRRELTRPSRGRVRRAGPRP